MLQLNMVSPSKLYSQQTKICSICGFLSRLKHYVPVCILNIIYSSLSMSNLNYDILAWSCKIGTAINKLHK